MFPKFYRTRALSLTVLFFIFVSITSFANPNDDLLDTILKNDIKGAEEILQSGGVNFLKIEEFKGRLCPTLEMSKFLLENEYSRLNPDRFLGLIMRCNGHHPDLTGEQLESNQKQLVSFALEKVANPDSLLFMAMRHLWEYEPRHFIGFYISEDLTEHYMLLALSKGAKFSKIEMFGPDSLRLLRTMLSNQFDPIDPNEAMSLTLSSSASGIKKNAIDLSLDAGADPNVLLEMAINKCHFTGGWVRILHIDKAEQKELIKTALARGAKFSVIRIITNAGQIPAAYEEREEIVKHAIDEGARYFDIVWSRPPVYERKQASRRNGCCSTCALL